MGSEKESQRQEGELRKVYASCQKTLCEWIGRAFPRLASQAEDIVQEAFLQALQRVREEQFSPEAGWYPWLRRVARSRALDRFRSWERRVFERLCSDTDSRESSENSDRSPNPVAVAREADPPRQLAEQERRARQGSLLSEILQEFCQWCEARPERAAIKEAYERSLRGQQPAEIAEAMGVSASRVYEYLNRARSWVLERIRQADVDRSVFLTLHRCKPE